MARDLVVALPLPDATEIHLVAAYQVPTGWAPDLGAGLAWIEDAESALQEHLHETLGTRDRGASRRQPGGDGRPALPRRSWGEAVRNASVVPPSSAPASPRSRAALRSRVDRQRTGRMAPH